MGSISDGTSTNKLLEPTGTYYTAVGCWHCIRFVANQVTKDLEMIDREPFVCGLRTRIETYGARTYEHEHILIATTLRTVITKQYKTPNLGGTKGTSYFPYIIEGDEVESMKKGRQNGWEPVDEQAIAQASSCWSWFSITVFRMSCITRDPWTASPCSEGFGNVEAFALTEFYDILCVGDVRLLFQLHSLIYLYRYMEPLLIYVYVGHKRINSRLSKIEQQVIAISRNVFVIWPRWYVLQKI